VRQGHGATHEHACVVRLHAVEGAQLPVLQLLPEDAQGAEAAATARVGRIRVLQEVLDRRHRDHKANVLRVLLVLEGNPDDFPILVDGRTARVAWVDGCVYLHSEQRNA